MKQRDLDPNGAIEQLTEISAPPLCPEIKLHLLPRRQSFAAFREATSANFGAAPPYWAIPWPGGQAIARYLLDNPQIARGKVVADLGSGSGIAAIAAAMAGATAVLAIDTDAAARQVLRANGRLNNANFAGVYADLGSLSDRNVDMLLAGDLWYDAQTARTATAILRGAAADGVTVIAGDVRRSHFPRVNIQLLADYAIPASEEFERSPVVQAGVFTILPLA